MIDSTKRITLATVKSFVKKGIEKKSMYIIKKTAFDGMIDGVSMVEKKVVSVTTFDKDKKNTFGIPGAWFVLGGGDYFTYVDRGDKHGIEVYNCCGCFELLTNK